MAEKKFGTHIVIKNEDVEKYSNEEGQKQFKAFTEKILKRRKNEGRSINYHVCNLDEPYADEVQDLILRGEAAYAEGKTPEEGWEFVPPIDVSDEKKDDPSEEELEKEPIEKEELEKLDEFIKTLPQKDQDRINSLKEEEKYLEARKLMEEFTGGEPEETEDDGPGAES